MGRRRFWSEEQRVEIVLASFAGNEPNKHICLRYHVSEPTLYKWRKLFVQGGTAFLNTSGVPNIKALIEENRHLRDMLAELSLAYRRLRDKQSDSTSRPRSRGRKSSSEHVHDANSPRLTGEAASRSDP